MRLIFLCIVFLTSACSIFPEVSQPGVQFQVQESCNGKSKPEHLFVLGNLGDNVMVSLQNECGFDLYNLQNTSLEITYDCQLYLDNSSVAKVEIAPLAKASMPLIGHESYVPSIECVIKDQKPKFSAGNIYEKYSNYQRFVMISNLSPLYDKHCKVTAPDGAITLHVVQSGQKSDWLFVKQDSQVSCL